jgi:hypothetical protein
MPSARTIFTTTEENLPATVPSSDTDVVSGKDVWLASVVLTNIGASSATITITDKQSTPVAIVKDLTVDPGVPVIFAMPKDHPASMPGGIKWQASAADTIVCRLRYQY